MLPNKGRKKKSDCTEAFNIISHEGWPRINNLIMRSILQNTRLIAEYNIVWKARRLLSSVLIAADRLIFSERRLKGQ